MRSCVIRLPRLNCRCQYQLTSCVPGNVSPTLFFFWKFILKRDARCLSLERLFFGVLRPSSSDAEEICFLGLSVFGLFWTLPIVVSFARYHLSKFLVIVWSSGFSLMSDGRPIAIILGADWWRFQHEIRFLNSSSMQCKDQNRLVLNVNLVDRKYRMLPCLTDDSYVGWNRY